MEWIVVSEKDLAISGVTHEVKETFKYGGSIIELHEDEVLVRNWQQMGIVPCYQLNLGKIEMTYLGKIAKYPVIVATIGQRIEAKEVSYYYHMEGHRWEEVVQDSNQQAIWIACYHPKHQVRATDYLRCIDYLHRLSRELQYPLIIIGNVESELPYFRSQPGVCNILDYYLDLNETQYIVWNHQAEISPMDDRKHYYYDYHKVESMMLKWLQKRVWRRDTGGDEGDKLALYNDSFYTQIPSDEKIYVPLNLWGDQSPTYYNDMGIETVTLGSYYTFLYDYKYKIDQHVNALKSKVLPNFYLQVLTPSPIRGRAINPETSYQAVKANVSNKGGHVCIGVITIEGVDYTQSFLRKSSGETRIVGIWDQISGSQGTYYSAEMINKALDSDKPQEIVPYVEQESYATTLLGLAGGSMENYEAIATEADYVVAKINTASRPLQTIYGGSPLAPGVLMPDILVAANKLMEMAQANQCPIVMIIPYNTNISSHDGSRICEKLLEILGTTQNCTLIIPSGEEADKRHHQSIARDGVLNPNVILRASQKTESLLGAVYINNTIIEPMKLYTPDGMLNPINLEYQGITKTPYGIVYSNGLRDDYNNGKRNILFRIGDMEPGTWKIQCMSTQMTDNIEMDLWITQEAMNPYVKLEPSSPFITVGSNSAIPNMVTTGSYDPENYIVLASSGRGYTWMNGIAPPCVVRGIGKIPLCQGGCWQQVEGTVVASSLLAGAVASIYDKWQVDLNAPYANSHIMRNIIVSNTTQFFGMQYPNRAQGYGVFELERLPEILNNLSKMVPYRRDQYD